MHWIYSICLAMFLGLVLPLLFCGGMRVLGLMLTYCSALIAVASFQAARRAPGVLSNHVEVGEGVAHQK